VPLQAAPTEGEGEAHRFQDFHDNVKEIIQAVSARAAGCAKYMRVLFVCVGPRGADVCGVCASASGLRLRWPFCLRGCSCCGARCEARARCALHRLCAQMDWVNLCVRVAARGCNVQIVSEKLSGQAFDTALVAQWTAQISEACLHGCRKLEKPFKFVGEGACTPACAARVLVGGTPARAPF
jgi:hypothetical protein